MLWPASQGKVRAPQFWAGLLLVAIFWPLNWALPGLRTAYLFFPLWLGFIFCLDGIVRRRTGTSLLTRSPAQFGVLFLLSIPAWWIFEAINSRTRNWEYLGGEHFSSLEFAVLSSISFSTVIPAVFEAAELVRSWRWTDAARSWIRVPIARNLAGLIFASGWLMLILALVWPRWAYPFVWTSLFFILEPINWWLRRETVLDDLNRGDWRSVLSLAAGALLCGFFWEFWNYWSYPKWRYHTPGANFLHIFEMPLLGYGGYLPFALELNALRNLLWPLVVRPSASRS